MSNSMSSSAIEDTQFFEEALREYRESTWDDRGFRICHSVLQHVILQRAQDIKERESRFNGHVTNITEKCA